MQFGISKNILRIADYTSIAVTIDATTEGTVTVNGQKILPAGTVLAGKTESVFKNKTRLAVKLGEGGQADGVLLNDVNLTDGNAPGACVYQGELYQDKVIDFAEGLRTQLPLIKFTK